MWPCSDFRGGCNGADFVCPIMLKQVARKRPHELAVRYATLPSPVVCLFLFPFVSVIFVCTLTCFPCYSRQHLNNFSAGQCIVGYSYETELCQVKPAVSFKHITVFEVWEIFLTGTCWKIFLTALDWCRYWMNLAQLFTLVNISACSISCTSVNGFGLKTPQ